MGHLRAVNGEVLHEREATVVRRSTLAPGETTAWLRDPCHRITVVLRGERLRIEWRDGGDPQPVEGES